MFVLFKKPVFNERGIYLGKYIPYEGNEQIIVLIFFPDRKFYMRVAKENELKEGAKEFLLQTYNGVRQFPGMYRNYIKQWEAFGNMAKIKFPHDMTTEIYGKLEGQDFVTIIRNHFGGHESTHNVSFKFLSI